MENFILCAVRMTFKSIVKYFSMDLIKTEFENVVKVEF